MVFQSFNLFPHLTAIRNVTLAPIKDKGKARHVPLVLPFVGLWWLRHTR